MSLQSFPVPDVQAAHRQEEERATEARRKVKQIQDTLHTPQRIHATDIDPDYRKHNHAFTQNPKGHCFRCGRRLKGRPACSIRIVAEYIVNAFWPMGGEYYAIGPECMKYVPEEYRMGAENCDVPCPNCKGTGWVSP